MRQLLLVPLVAACAAESASASAQATATKPASPTPAVADTVKPGTYDLEVTTDDGTMVGSLVVRRAVRGPNATLTVGGHQPEVTSFVRDGPTYVLTAGHDQFTVIYSLTFAGDSLNGVFRMSGGPSGTVRGSWNR